MQRLVCLMMFCVFLSCPVAWEFECGQITFTGPSGYISSPSRRLWYRKDRNCRYFIDVGGNNSVLLTASDFDWRQWYLTTDICRYDWITITCNETNYENLDFRKRTCGSNLPRLTLRFFSCPVVVIDYFSSSLLSIGGFRIEYMTFEKENTADGSPIPDLPCGDQTLFTSSSGVIILPRNPTEYSTSTVNCNYTITANDTREILFGLSTLHLPQLLDSFADCNREYIMVGCVAGEEEELTANASNTYCRHSFDHNVHLNHLVFSNCRTVKISIRSWDYNYRQDHGIPFTVRAHDEVCGNSFFTGTVGSIVSPLLPLSRQNGLNCLYTIDVVRTETVSLEFQSLQLEGTSNYPSIDDCTNDWLEISCPTNSSVPANPDQRRKYCGEIGTQMILNYSRCDSLTLDYVTNSSIHSGRFQLRYKIKLAEVLDDGCGNTSVGGLIGFITSPQFPHSYPNDLNCVYSLDVDQTKTAELHFLAFNVEGSSRPAHLDNCHFDWLMISCSTNDSLASVNYRNRKYCGEKSAPMTLSYSGCESLTLNFVSDSSVTSAGFKIRYTIKSADQTDCDNTVFSDPSGVITSPNFPFSHPEDMNCRYVINAGRKSSFLLKFTHFVLAAPKSAGYCTDWLMISCNETTKENPNYNKKYCGSIQWTSSLGFSDCSSLVLEFFAHSSNNSEGFMIEYTVIEDSDLIDDHSELDCGATLFTNTSGVIEFPRNPKKTLASVNCNYTISISHPSYVCLNSDSIIRPLLESFQDCDREGLMIECVSEKDPELNPNRSTVFCRTEEVHISTGSISMLFVDCRMLKLSIRSTNYDNGEEFRLHFSVHAPDEVCGNTSFSAPSGIVSTRGLPVKYLIPADYSCAYVIDDGHVNSFSLSVENLFTGIYSRERETLCENSWLTITCLVNGKSVAHPIADRKLCGTQYQQLITLFPACRSVLLNYTNNFIVSGPGFTLRYNLGDYDPECGNVSFSGPSGLIALPPFSLSHRYHDRCLYYISGNQRTVISITFLVFRVPADFRSLYVFPGDHCSWDWVSISCWSDQSTPQDVISSQRYCGVMIKPLRITFPSCSLVVIAYRSDSRSGRGEFKLRYTVVDTDLFCGVSAYDRPNGTISVPSNYAGFDDSFDCKYFINSTEPSSISLTIWSTSIQGSVGRNCQSDWLLISCNSGRNVLDHKVSHRTCDHFNSTTVLALSNCSTAQIVLHKDAELTGKTFRIEYTVKSYGDTVFSGQMNTNGQLSHAFAISSTVILLATATICLGAFLIFRRRRKKIRSMMLLQSNEDEDAHQL